MAAQELRLPTDSFVEPDDTDFYIMGRMEGKKAAKTDTQQAGGTDGEFGHEVQ
jgi:pilus assembly protein CpaC